MHTVLAKDIVVGDIIRLNDDGIFVREIIIGYGMFTFRVKIDTENEFYSFQPNEQIERLT